MSEFILMLTRDDLTVADASSILDELAHTGLTHVGFKDVGVPFDEMKRLVGQIHDMGANAHLEVVSLSEDDELRSADAAVQLGVDYLIGGTTWRRVGPMAVDAGLHYLPYVGGIVGHPAELQGSVDGIVAEARDVGPRFGGVNLLAFRHRSVDPVDLLTQVAALPFPTICAGSIDTVERVRTVADTGVWAFTIGTAILDRRVAPGGTLADQVTATLAAASSPAASSPAS
jgi:hypothetical protein